MFQQRRKRLMQALPKNAMVMLTSGVEKNRNKDVNYPFRVNSDFYYLTGFDEQNCAILLTNKKYIIFVRAKNKKAEMWHGKRLGLKQAREKLGADASKNINSIKKELPKLIQKYKLYTDLGNLNDEIKDIISTIKCIDIIKIIAEMRVIKDESEIKNIQQSCKISDAAHKKVMKSIKNMQYEYQVQSIFDGYFSYHNCQNAYPSIVASGNNANTLHYTKNNAQLKQGDLILIDAGCEYNYYASDITRTFPINGKFSLAQKQIYNIVLKAQIAAIAVVKSGVSIKQPHIVATKIIKQGLIDLDIMQTTDDIKQFFPHGTSHFMGLDVHDSGKYKINNQDRELVENMVITIEPGIYLGFDDKIAKKYQGIGIRIEDDILVGKSNSIVLTNAPKTIQEIENIML